MGEKMTRFQSEEFIKRYFQIGILTAKELEQIVRILIRSKGVQTLIAKDTQALNNVIKTLNWR